MQYAQGFIISGVAGYILCEGGESGGQGDMVNVSRDQKRDLEVQSAGVYQISRGGHTVVTITSQLCKLL